MFRFFFRPFRFPLGSFSGVFVTFSIFDKFSSRFLNADITSLSCLSLIFLCFFVLKIYLSKLSSFSGDFLAFVIGFLFRMSCGI